MTVKSITEEIEILSNEFRDINKLRWRIVGTGYRSSETKVMWMPKSEEEEKRLIKIAEHIARLHRFRSFLSIKNPQTTTLNPQAS